MSVSRVRRLNANANDLAGNDAFYEAMIIERHTRPIEGTLNVLRQTWLEGTCFRFAKSYRIVPFINRTYLTMGYFFLISYEVAAGVCGHPL